MLEDTLFMQMARGVNPGRQVFSANPDILAHVQDHSDMQDNLLLLYSIVRSMRAQRILELGTADGTSTLALLKAAQEIGGTVTSVDEQSCPAARALVKHFDYGDIWDFHQMRTEQYFMTLFPDAMFEVVLIDASHYGHESYRDWQSVQSHITESGIVFFHDSFFFRNHDSPGCAETAWRILHDTDWQAITFPFNCNMTIVQRRTPVTQTIQKGLEYHHFTVPPARP